MSTDRLHPTERFARTLALASDQADALGHAYVTCQHLLYALAREGKGLAAAVLDAVGASAEAVRTLLEESSAPHDRIEGRLEMSGELADVLDGAAAAAHAWGHRWIDTEHLLFALVKQPTSADDLLADLHILPADIAARLEAMRQAAPPAAIREEASHAYRFALESAWVLSMAADSARREGATQVTGVHLLIALLTLKSAAQRVLVDELGISAQVVADRLPDTLTVKPAQGRRVPLGDDVQQILGHAIGEAWNRGHLAVTPLHLAMGLVRGDHQPALAILADLGISQTDLLEALEAVMPPATVR